MPADDPLSASILGAPHQPSVSGAGGDPRALSPTICGVGGRPLRPSTARVDVHLPAPILSESRPGAVSGRRECTSGGGSPHGDPVGATGGRHPDGRPRFDQPVPSGGYLWWYVDGVSTCGAFGLSIIIFVGSVFSPYYYWARQRASRQGLAVNAEDHCAINVALYGPRQHIWTMTERSARSLSRSEDSYALAGSSVHWQHGELLIRIDERAMPLGGRVRGEVRLRAPRLFPFQTALDAQGRHRWGPIAPTADIRAEFEHPKIRWEGHGYLDSNEGDEPIDQPFRSWDWSRTLLPDGSVAVIYDVRPEGATNRLLALSFKPSGEVDNFTPGGRQPLGRTLWGLSRQIRADDHPAPRSSVVKTLEDTPFYARSLLNTQIMGEETLTMHETLDLTRLRSNVVRLMLPFRMPRLR